MHSRKPKPPQNGNNDGVAPGPVQTGWEWGCTKVIKWYDCPAGETENPEDNPACIFLYSECIEYGYRYVEEDPPPGGGGGSDNGDPCEPCINEPGGPQGFCENQPGGADGIPQGCAVEENNDIVEPCDTDDPIIDNNEDVFETLWENSDVDKPIDQRQEQGGFITEDSNGEYGFEPFPSNWTYSACGISHPNGWESVIPHNTVGVVHTHPFMPGDNTKSVCGEDGTENYTSGTNAWDLDFVADVQNHLTDYSIKGYILDGGNIVTFGTLGTYEEDNRCGY